MLLGTHGKERGNHRVTSTAGDRHGSFTRLVTFGPYEDRETWVRSHPSGKSGLLTQFSVVIKLTHHNTAVKSKGFGIGQTWIRVPGLPRTNYVASGRLPYSLRFFVLKRVAVWTSQSLGRGTGDSVPEILETSLVPRKCF